MEEITSSSPMPKPVQTSTASELESLRYVLQSVLVLTLVISGTFNIFLMRQLKYAQVDRDNLRPQAEAIMTEYNQMSAGLKIFVNRLVEFSKKNPDFVPILQKYGFDPAAQTNAAGTATPSPGQKK
jgi:hypothetical protein